MHIKLIELRQNFAPWSCVGEARATSKIAKQGKGGREAPKLTSVKIIFFHLPLNYNTGVL